VKIKDYMKRDFRAVSPDAPLREIARFFYESGESLLPVTEENGQLVGVIFIDDFILIFLPDYIDLIRNIDFLHDFGALERTSFTVEEQLFVAEDLMKEEFVVLEEDESILKAAAMLHKHDQQRIPVVKGDRMVGMISQNDVCRAIYDLEGRS
jgi:CBS domain-containing protein